MKILPSHIRNFSIIAHIDHGKSTLADRLLERTGTIPARQMQEQVLDGMDLERERGITIKAKAVRMIYKPKQLWVMSHESWEKRQDSLTQTHDTRLTTHDEQFILNLIDTPGHVDFSYEVSRALAACEGALLVVDASQGVEAQTLSNATIAQEVGLTLLPVINKIDLPQADPESTAKQIREILKVNTKPIFASAKEGTGVEQILEEIIKKIPPPKGKSSDPLSALVFDSTYDPYRGVVIFVRLFSGEIFPGKRLIFFSNQLELVPEEIGYLTPKMTRCEKLTAGEVGYIATGLKNIHLVAVGDTVMEKGSSNSPLPGYRPTKPFVFAGFYPQSPSEYENLRTAMEKLHLSDSAFVFEPESSSALGFGYRCGFLGLLHMEIVKERLLREFQAEVLVTHPNVIYRIRLKNDQEVEVDSPSKFPHWGEIQAIAEPLVKTSILLPSNCIGAVMDMVKERRGKFLEMTYLTPERVLLKYELPLAEILVDFHDALKSISKGYASFDYEPSGYEIGNLVKLEILIHGKAVDAFSAIVHAEKAYPMGKAMLEKLKELIPRHLFEVALQAQVHGRIVARETIRGFRKDVIAKCYGGDITRKRKLLEKQKQGKKKMKMIGKVEIPNEAFMSLLQLGKR